MSSNPSSKWFWNDWDNDNALRLCSLAAQGLWMRMLSIAARATPTGYVIVNGRSVDATDLAHVTGASEAEIRCLIDELEDRRVFSRDRHHRIYNRRMVRDDRDHHAAVKNGKKGGNPALTQAIGTKKKKSGGLTPPITPALDPYTLSPVPKKDSEAKASANASASAPPSDPIKILWDRGLALVGAQLPDARARRLIGGWRREFTDAAVMAAIVACEHEAASEPVAFIAGCLHNSRKGANGHGRRSASEDRMRAGFQAILDADREEDLLSGEGVNGRHYT